jgi:hypothetical protein
VQSPGVLGRRWRVLEFLGRIYGGGLESLRDGEGEGEGGRRGEERRGGRRGGEERGEREVLTIGC